MTPNEHAAKVANLAQEIVAAMTVFPRLSKPFRYSVVTGANVTIDRLEAAFGDFLACLNEERTGPTMIVTENASAEEIMAVIDKLDAKEPRK